MIEDGKPCVDIAQQLRAVESAVSNAKRELIQDHIDHCLADSENGGGHTPLAELKAIAKFL
jgi:DNA-binding FrmR family transcriptional regulator